MSDGEDEYGQLGISDENDNYDDFMMSGDEDVDIVEMEDGTDDEEGVPAQDRGRELASKEAGVFDEQAMQELCDGAGCYLEDQDFIRARSLLDEITTRTESHAETPLAIIWRWRSYSQITRSWLCEMHYNGIDRGTYQGTLEAFRVLIDHLKRFSKVLDGNGVRNTLAVLTCELSPTSKRDFLFDVELINDDSLALKMQLRLQCIALLQDLLLVVDEPWTDELKDTLELKKIEAKVWSDRLSNGRINLYEIQEMERSCYEINKDDAVNDQRFTEKVGLVLQCHIFNYFSGSTSVPRELFSDLIDKLEYFSSNSLSVSQHLGLMILLNTARALVMLPDFHEDDKCMQVQVSHSKVRDLREQFWGCLRHMEEIGGSRQKFCSIYERFILAGFIFCSMILHRTEHEKIDPFDLEQLKVALEVPSVQLLQAIYHHYLQLDLQQLYASIQRLSEVKDLLKELIRNIYYLAQLSKLWKQIAPVYSCISLGDIQDLLEIDRTIKVSRDDLLTILMTSILNDTADVFYKLDLTKDLVYFGDEYKVSLCSYPKKSFVKRTVSIESGVKLSHLEIANNIGIFDEPSSLKGFDSCTFFDKLQRSRDSILAHDSHGNGASTGGFQRAELRYSDNYEELAGLAYETLNSGHLER